MLAILAVAGALFGTGDGTNSGGGDGDGGD